MTEERRGEEYGYAEGDRCGSDLGAGAVVKKKQLQKKEKEKEKVEK